MRGRRRNNNEGETNHDVNNFAIDSDSDDESSSSTENSDFVVSESEISYSIESFNAVATPVTITMILSALVVVYINTPETIAAGEEIYAKTYQIFRVGEENQTAASNLGYSLVNTLVIVCVICVLTFVVVLCYKFRCMKLFYAYMVLVTAALLGFFTLQIFIVAVSVYPWLGNIDKLSLAFVLYNYAVVGTLAIFLPRGFPKWVSQGYLIAGSVCMAWELSFFNEWMTWCLLVMLALYDLFAVLTPCGPLKALANLISREGAPSLPGMLYEADLPSGAQRRSTRNSRRTSRTSEERREGQDGARESRGENSGNDSRRTTPMTSMTESNSDTSLREETQQSRESRRRTDSRERERARFSGEQQQYVQHGQDQINHQQSNESQERALPPVDMSNRGKVPIVLARMYKLPVLDKRGVLRTIEQQSANQSTGAVRQHQIYYSAEEILETEWTPQQLKTEVTCIFPPRGGKIARAKSRDQRYDAGIAYIVYSRSGEQQRKFVVTPMGAVKEVLRRETSGEDDSDENDDNKKNTIKLGIGDFIFYSLLVSQAAQNSFTAFSACLLVVLMGLAATLVILAIKGKALPALPISIFLGVVFFLWTTYFVKPWIDDFIVQSIYV